MAKRKSKATIMVADGRGGTVQVQDRRFEAARDWPIQFEVPTQQSETWLEYFSAECARRGWSSNGISQIEARENSGSVNVNSGSVDKPQLALVWERKRGGGLRIRARSTGAPELLPAETQELFENVDQRCRTGALERVYRRWHLEYEGLPWRGEFWLNDTLRLGPPSRQYERALFGPRAIVVDGMVSCIGLGDAPWVFDKQLRELAAFLSVVLNTAVHVTENGRQVWCWGEGSADCAVRNLGFWDEQYPPMMPNRGACRSTPLRQVSRPDFADHALEDQTLGEKLLPSDIADLWASYQALTPEKRLQFLQAAVKWQEALTLWRDRDTLSVALMVIACESLKPPDQQFRDHNIYHVVEALLGKASLQRLQVDWFRAQDVRNVHLHAGEFRGAEFAQAAINSSYQDPTFDEARRELAPTTREAIIEWLRRGGLFSMPRIERRRTLRRWTKEHALVLLPVAAILGIFFGWFLNHVAGLLH